MSATGRVEATNITSQGFVLAGGASSRMGRDKALLDWHGQPMLVHVASMLSQVTAKVTIVGARDKYSCLGFPVIEDRKPGLGPLSGISAALAASESDWNLIVACDMPYLNPELLKRLLDAAATCAADCLMPAGQPLCAAYHRRCLPAVDQALASGVRKVRQALEQLRVDLFEVGQVACFQNLNSPADWAARPIETP